MRGGKGISTVGRRHSPRVVGAGGDGSSMGTSAIATPADLETAVGPGARERGVGRAMKGHPVHRLMQWPGQLKLR